MYASLLDVSVAIKLTKETKYNLYDNDAIIIFIATNSNLKRY